MKNEIKKMAEILAGETYHISDMYYQAEKLDKQLWAWLHLGFIAGLKANGWSDKDCNEIVEKTQEILSVDNSDTNTKKSV